MRKHVKPFVLSLMVLGLVFGSASLVAAVNVPITLVDGDWTNPVPATPGVITIVNSGASGGLSTARWGEPVAPTGQSGYDFLSATTPFNAVTGPPAVNFALGTFTHNNFPINGTFLTSIDLAFRMSIDFTTPLTATFAFSHNETPNNANPPSNPLNNDLVTLVDPVLNANFTYLGNPYFFSLLGFSTDGGTTIKTSFSTIEGQANTATLYGVITATPISAPEPLTMLLLGLGLVGLAGFRKRS